MNTYTLYFKDGKKDVIKGNNIKEALNSNDYSEDILFTLSFFDESDASTEHCWNPDTKVWELVKPTPKRIVESVLDQQMSLLQREADKLQKNNAPMYDITPLLDKIDVILEIKNLLLENL